MSSRRSPASTFDFKSWTVAAMIRQSTRRGSDSPIRWTSRVSSTRSKAAWALGSRVPTSSRNNVPPFACSKAPGFSAVTSGRAPALAPASSSSILSRGSWLTWTVMNGPFLRALISWIAWAARSLPVPVSPERSTGTSLPAARSICSKTSRNARERPTRDLTMLALSCSSAPVCVSGVPWGRPPSGSRRSMCPPVRGRPSGTSRSSRSGRRATSSHVRAVALARDCRIPAPAPKEPALILPVFKPRAGSCSERARARRGFDFPGGPPWRVDESDGRPSLL